MSINAETVLRGSDNHANISMNSDLGKLYISISTHDAPRSEPLDVFFLNVDELFDDFLSDEFEMTHSGADLFLDMLEKYMSITKRLLNRKIES